MQTHEVSQKGGSRWRHLCQSDQTRKVFLYNGKKTKQQKRVGRAATTALDVRRTKKTSISRVMMKIVAFFKYISSPFLR